MKKIFAFVVLAIIIIVTSCSEDDDGYSSDETYIVNETPIVGSRIDHPYYMLLIKNQEELEEFMKIPYKKIEGGVIITNCSDLRLLSSVEEITMELVIYKNNKLKNLLGLNNLNSLGNLSISSNDSLKNLEGLDNLSSIGGLLVISSNDVLTSLLGLGGLTTINGLSIRDNSALTSLSGLNDLSSIGDGLLIYNNTVLFDFCALKNTTFENIKIYNVENNVYNPTKEELESEVGCSQ